MSYTKNCSKNINYDYLFEKVFQKFEPFAEGDKNNAPSLKFDEKTQVYSTEINVAVYKKNEIHIEIEDDFIKVLAENEKYGKARRYLHIEDVDSESINAILEDGVLSISAKKIAAKRPRIITVR
jgi:HSP20 family molecular chaperone IbpA